MKWENFKLKQIADYWTGKIDSSVLDETNYVSTDNLIPDKAGIVNSNYVPKSGRANSFSENDVLISNIRPYFRKIWFANKEGGCSNDVLVFRAKENVEPLYLYYQLSKDTFFDYMVAGSNGTKMPRGNKTSIMEYQLQIPPLPTQRRIASILSAYDDLIENNLKRIKLLEEKAFLRYKQIVREEKMEVEGKLENFIRTVKRKTKVPKADYKEKGEFPIIDQSTDFIGGYTNEKEAIYNDLPMIVFGDHTRILKYINFPFACGADGTQLVKPEHPNISVAYLYFELISCNLANYHYARHFKFLKEQVIRLPSEKVMLEYNVETDNIFNLIQLLRLQNTLLRSARDILLPRLMNGQIEV